MMLKALALLRICLRRAMEQRGRSDFHIAGRSDRRPPTAPVDAYFCDPARQSVRRVRDICRTNMPIEARAGDSACSSSAAILVSDEAGAQGHGLQSRGGRIAHWATPSPSSTRCSRNSAPASWRRKAASCFTAAGRSSASCPDHPNAVGPRKRPLHTIIPGMLVKNGMGRDAVRRHGRPLSGDRSCSLSHPPADGWSRSTGRGELCVWREVRARTDHWSRQGPELETSRSQDRLDYKAIGRLPSDQIDRERGRLIGGSDPRKDGMAFGY